VIVDTSSLAQDQVLTQEDPVAAAQKALQNAKIANFEAKAAAEDATADAKALHQKEMLASKALDMAQTTVQTTDDPAPDAQQASIAAAGAEEANAAVAKEKARAAASDEERKNAVAESEAEGTRKKTEIEAQAKADADAAQAKATQLAADSEAEKAKAKVKAETSEKQAELDASALEKKAEIDAELKEKEFKMEADQAKAKAEVDAVKAKADAKVKLQIAQAEAVAKAADEKKTKNDLQDQQDKLKLSQASADEVARKKDRSAKENADKQSKKDKLEAKLKQRSATEKQQKEEAKDKTPGAKKVKRLARRASRSAHELARKATRSTRRKNRAAREKLEDMQEEAQDAVKAQARQAIKVLRREAQAAGLKQKDSDALTPELMRLGDEPAMTQEQQDALKAAYAVGAARRAAKMAWMKVVAKMDKGTHQREAKRNQNAPSVAAATAMKALVQELKEAQSPAERSPENLMSTQTTYKVDNAQDIKVDASSDPEDQLRLPEDSTWRRWGHTPQLSANPIPEEGEEPAKEPAYDVNELPPPDDVEAPMNIGMQLPKDLTNKDAGEIAQQLVSAENIKVDHVKTAVGNDSADMERQTTRLAEEIKQAADTRHKEVLEEVDDDVAVMKKDLKLAEERQKRTKQREEVLTEKEESDGAKVVEMMKKFQKNTGAAAIKAAEDQKNKVEEQTKEIIDGQDSQSIEWDAKLFAPKNVVLSDSEYQKMQQKKKKLLEEQAKKEKDAQMLIEEDRKKTDLKAKTEKDQLQQKRKNKSDRVKTALAALKTAKDELAEQLNSEPEGEGISAYLDTPATPNGDGTA